MASTGSHQEVKVEKFVPSNNLKTVMWVLIGLGLLSFVIGLRSPERLWPAYLTAFFYFSCLGLGGLFFTSIQHIAKAGWSTSIRRLSESMTAFIPFILVGGIILLLGMKTLFPWADPAVVASKPLVAAKVDYLNVQFFAVRLVLFCVGWLVFRHLIVGNSVKQDSSGDESLTHKNVGLSIGFILFFAISFTLFSMDLLMSLLPTWYSTIFGIYTFSGLFQSSLAFLALMIIFMKRSGFIKGYVTTEHLHDVVKFLKGFTVFWAYIAFCQYMLIWYANIPEETEYYLMRSQNSGWIMISMALLIFRFIVPFLALLPRGLKRNENHVILVSCLILVMQYVDIYWMVYPNFFHGHVTFGLIEIGLFAGFAGVFLYSISSFLQKNSIVAIKDPRLHEAVNHHVTY
jgi:hypothetical protein